MRPWRIQQNENPYHITTRTNGRQFRLCPRTYEIFIYVLLEAMKRFSVHIQHFKLMENHYHLKMFTPLGNISAAMQFINFQLALLINRQDGVKGHLWEQRFHATIIESDAYEFACVRYIYQNGVRAGLCRRASDDPRLSSFAFYAKGKLIPFVVVADDFYLALGSTPQERQTAFVEIMNAPMSDAQSAVVRQGLRRSFFGSPDFMACMRQKYSHHFHSTRR